MSRPRPPRLAGVAGGVGTTTLATALRGYDRGRDIEAGVEVLVCRSTGDSLHAAATTVSWLGSLGLPPPVLAVVADQPVPPRGSLRARMRMIEPQVSGLILMPYVAHWRELTNPLAEAARLSEYPADQLPRPLRGYAEALAHLAEAVLSSGLLTAGRPVDRFASPRPPLPVSRSTGPLRHPGLAEPAAGHPATTGPRAAVTGAIPLTGAVPISESIPVQIAVPTSVPTSVPIPAASGGVR